MKKSLILIFWFSLIIIVAKSTFGQTASFNYNTTTDTIGSTYSWIDCSSGTEIVDADWTTTGAYDAFDDGYININFPFAFRYYDDNYTTADQLSICTNGFIRLDGTADDTYSAASGYNLTSTATSLGQIICLGTQDDNTEDATSTVHYLTTGTAPNRIFTVEFQNLEINYTANRYVDIEVSFYETSNKVVILMGADNVTTTSADIGIHSGVSGYFNKWQEVQSGTNNAWIEYTIPPFIWDGSSNTSWVVAANWNRNALPTSTDDVLIPSGTPNEPQLPTGNNGYCKNLTINSAAVLTINNSSKNLNVYGDIVNDGTLSVPGGYNILLRGTDNVIKGSGVFNSNVKFRLRGTGTIYTLETDLSIYRFDIFVAEANCILNINDRVLTCSNRIRNSSLNSTVNITTGAAETKGVFVMDGVFNSGTGTVYYSKSGDQTITNVSYYNLKLGGSGTKSSSAALTTNGDITIESGSTLNQNGHTINIAGNWSNSGTFTQGTQTVTFDGISAQTIGGATTTTFYNFTINNSAGVSLSHLENVSNTLTLSSGIISTTSSNPLVFGTAATAVSGGSNTSHIDGPARKDGSGSFVFPIGDGGKYARIGISNLSGTDNFTAEYHNATPTNNTSFTYPITKVSDNEYWNLDRAGASVSATITLYWEDSQWSGIGSFADLRIMHYASSWTAESGTYSNTGSVGLSAANAGSISVTNVSNFSPFSLGTIDNINNPLPIELLSFSAHAEGDVVLVNWQTATEQDNDYFIIERSIDGIHSERIGTVSGAGNSNVLLDYSFVDQKPYSGTSYYRLTQVDYNGQSETFDWLAVNRSDDLQKSVAIYPNPLSTSMLNMKLHNIQEKTQLIIYDFSGRIVYQRNIDVSNDVLHFNLELPNGSYSLQLINNESVIMKKLIVNR